MALGKKLYLGDGVYVQPGVYDGELIVTTEDGLHATNTIVLEPAVGHALCDFLTGFLGREKGQQA